MNRPPYKYRLNGAFILSNDECEYNISQHYIMMNYKPSDWWMREIGMNPEFFPAIFMRKPL